MNKEFVTYNQALALKELGFDEPCFGYHVIQNYYSEKIGDFKTVNLTNGYVGYGSYSALNSRTHRMLAPLYQQAFRWFRDVHELEGVPQKADSFSWFKFCIWKYTSNGKHRVNDAFDFEHKIYEEAESACLDKLIEITKNK